MSQGIKIVTPDWALDSADNKTKCDEDLYHTKLLVVPKSPTPSPPPPPTPPPPPPVIPPAEPPPRMMTQVMAPTRVTQILQHPMVSTVASHVTQPTVSAQPQASVGLPQKMLWQERMAVSQPPPQQTQIATGVTSTPEGIRATMNWQHRPPQTILTSSTGGGNPRAALWQQQVFQISLLWKLLIVRAVINPMVHVFHTWDFQLSCNLRMYLSPEMRDIQEWDFSPKRDANFRHETLQLVLTFLFLVSGEKFILSFFTII